MIKLLFCGIFLPCMVAGQELYVYADPASNVPAGSLSARLSNRFQRGHNAQFSTRQQAEANIGLSTAWMIRSGISFSNMYGSYRPEGGYVYTKYRFVSLDGLKQHFRMAAFAETGYSTNPFLFEEIDLTADQTGVTGGLTATMLVHKTAFSGTAAYASHFQNKINEASQQPPVEKRATSGVWWNVSAGQLVFPFTYSSYNQPNLNVYVTVSGQWLQNGQYFTDVAPALQMILYSALKINAGFRFQASGKMRRMATQSWLISMEYTWLKKRKRQVLLPANNI